MDFELSDDQVALQEGIRNLCEGRFDIETVRGFADTAGVDRSRWAELGETGVFGLSVDEAVGGLGLGLSDVVLVFEELGRAAIPGPLVASLLAAGIANGAVDGAIDGTAVVGLIEHNGGTGPWMVEHLDALDSLLVLFDNRVDLVSVSELSGQALEQPLDPLTPVHRVAELPAGSELGGAEMAADLRLRGTIVTAALQLGLAEAALALGVSFAKEREQFGKPIGSFQAIKHLCADMLTHVEVTRAAVYAAAVHFDQPDTGNVERAAAGAKLLASQAGSFCGKTCTQIHGGMGYTWEVDAHLYLKRSWVLDTVFGDTEHHAETVASFL